MEKTISFNPGSQSTSIFGSKPAQGPSGGIFGAKPGKLLLNQFKNI